MPGHSDEEHLFPTTTNGQRYDNIIASIVRKAEIRAALDHALSNLESGIRNESQTRADLEAIGALDKDSQSITSSILSTPAGDSIMMALDAQVGGLSDQIMRLSSEAVNLDPIRALISDPRVYQYLDPMDRLKMIEGFTNLMVGPDSGNSGFKPAPFQFQVMPNGNVLSFNPNSGSVSVVGNFPDAVQKQIDVDRAGNLVAVNPFSGEVSVLQEGYGFAQIDPRVEFQVGTALGLAGIEVQQRGQMISALGQDMANRIQIGMMTYEEARTNVATVSEALSQRRADTEIALRYAVPKSSIYTDPASGQRMSNLPGSDALINILADSTGERVDNLFKLPVGTIDPNASAQDVINAGAFASPIPGLMAELERTRSAVTSLAGASIADAEVARAATAKITGGM